MKFTRRSPPRARGICLLVAFVLVAALPHPVFGQVEARETAQLKRIGVVWGGAISPVPLVAALREGLREHGWIEGKNVVIELRSADNPDRLAEMVAELVRLPVDVLVTSTMPSSLMLKKATQTIPIVLAAPDPVGAGLVTPGGNVAAWSGDPSANFAASQRGFEVLREVMPGLSGIAVVVTSASMNPAAQPNAQRAREAAQAAGLQVIPIDVQDLGHLDVALAGLRDKGAQAIFFVPDNRFLRDTRVWDVITATGLPTFCPEREYAEAGCVLSYGPERFTGWRQGAASYVDQILRGTRPADLPIGRQTRFELVINAGSAKTIGLIIPLSVLKRADVVIP